jgi:hypothetical protein
MVRLVSSEKVEARWSMVTHAEEGSVVNSPPGVDDRRLELQLGARGKGDDSEPFPSLDGDGNGLTVAGHGEQSNRRQSRGEDGQRGHEKRRSGAAFLWRCMRTGHGGQPTWNGGDRQCTVPTASPRVG